MYISGELIKSMLEKYNIKIKGILHVGAHKCEEKNMYNTILNVDDSDIVWVDANPKLIEENKNNGIPNCYCAALDEKEQNTTFKITNNGQSSSLLDFGTHATSHRDIVVTDIIDVKTQSLNTFFESNNLDVTKYNIWNFDIQGSELHVFRGSKNLLKYADCIYTEVNTGEVYKGCGLLNEIDLLLEGHGFIRIQTYLTGENWGDALYIRTNK